MRKTMNLTRKHLDSSPTLVAAAFAIILLTIRISPILAKDVAPRLSSAADSEPFTTNTADEGVTDLTSKDAVPNWPKPTTAPKGAPNIVLILLDDIGFGDTSTFGGEAHTPELDKLAKIGLRYNNFNTTAMCSPTRAALLTGRNHHRVGFGAIAEFAGGYPGYNSVWKKSTASIAEVLRESGYSSAAFGKWHNTPDWEVTPTGPFERWPTGLGFEYFYGFMGPSGGENQWEPSRLYLNTTPVDPASSPAKGYHFTTDMTNAAIRWVQTHESLAPDSPYFLYFATGAVHAPHHVPKKWIDDYKGKFDRGWDRINRETFARQKRLGVVPTRARLTPRPTEIPAWISLSADQQKLYARQMEIYAGFVSHTDYEVGRLLKAVRSGLNGDNTLVLYVVGDNGSASGPLDGFASGTSDVQEQLTYLEKLGGPDIPVTHYSSGWAWVGNTPFQYWKTIASHFGGVRAPLIVSWPMRIKDHGGLRSQFTHVNDVAATLCDVLGISFPKRVNGVEQAPLDGTSFAQTFDSSTVRSAHSTQYFELAGNRAIYHDGWVAAARHESSSDDRISTNDLHFAKDRWELYFVADDFSQAMDLASQYPDKLHELQALFDEEARRNDVYPLGGARSAGKPSPISGRRQIIYYPDTPRIPSAVVPKFAKINYRLVADVTIPEEGAQGVIASLGDRANGFVWYIKDGFVIYENKAGAHHTVIRSRDPLPRGDVALEFEFVRDSPESKNKNWWETSSGSGRIYVNGKLAGEAILTVVEDWLWGNSLYIGQVVGVPVTTSFLPPFKFSGSLKQVKFEML